MGVFSELFSDNSTAGLEDVVQINFQLVEISLEDIIDLLLRRAQVQLHVFQAGFDIIGQLLGALLHVLVRYKRANHAEPVKPYRFVTDFPGESILTVMVHR